MGSTDDPDSDMETPAILPPQHKPTRRVSAPSILDTVSEYPNTTTALVHHTSSSSSSCSKSPTHSRKLPILPLSPELFRAGYRTNPSLRRSHSLEKLAMSCDKKCHREALPNSKISTRSLRKKHSLPPPVKETHFNTPSSCERIQRRRGSVSVLQVMPIPEDSGLMECPEIPDSGRGSVDSEEVVKSRAHRQVSIDEGIGAEYLAEEDGSSS